MQMQDLTLKAELQQWLYEPLAWPLPLPSGALVSVTKVLKSNTFVVIPADNNMAMQTIQIQCRAVACKFSHYMFPLNNTLHSQICLFELYRINNNWLVLIFNYKPTKIG